MASWHILRGFIGVGSRSIIIIFLLLHSHMAPEFLVLVWLFVFFPFDFLLFVVDRAGILPVFSLLLLYFFFS